MNFFLFYQFTVLSSHVVDGDQMYFGGSGVDKASTIGTGISLTPPLIFTGGQKSKKVRNMASFKTSLAFENAARYPISETKMQCCCDRPVS